VIAEGTADEFAISAVTSLLKVCSEAESNALIASGITAISLLAQKRSAIVPAQLPPTSRRLISLLTEEQPPLYLRIAALICATEIVLHYPRHAEELRLRTTVLECCVSLLHAVPHTASIASPSLVSVASRAIRKLLASHALPDSVRYSATVKVGANNDGVLEYVVCDKLDVAVQRLHALPRLDAVEAAGSLAGFAANTGRTRLAEAAARATPWILADVTQAAHALSIVVGEFVRSPHHPELAAYIVFSVCNSMRVHSHFRLSRG